MLQFTETELSKLTPYYIQFDQNLGVLSVGDKFELLCEENGVDLALADFFIDNNGKQSLSAELIKDIDGQHHSFLVCTEENEVKFSGSFSILSLSNSYLFIGLPQVVVKQKASDRHLKILTQISENNINSVIITNAFGRVVWVNESFTKVTGYTFDEALGQIPGDLLMGPESDRSKQEYIVNQIRQGKPFHTEIVNYRKNKDKIWARLTGQPIENEDGHVTGYYVIAEDVTQDKNHARRFRLAFETIGDHAWEYNFKTRQAKLFTSNNTFFGIPTDRLSDNLGLWLEVIHPEDVHIVEDYIAKYQSGQIDAHQLEYRVRLENGEYIWVLDRGVVMEKDENGVPTQVVGSHIDISEHKQLELELTRSREQAESLAKAKEMFLANMSHEMRTPMNAIIGMGAQLIKTELSEEQNVLLNTINMAANNLLVIINDILDFSKIEAGKLRIDHIGFEPKNIVSGAMQILAHRAEEKGLVLMNSYCDAKLANVLIGDPYRLTQVLLNLIGNAIKFTNEGKIDVTCTVIEECDKEQIVQCKITDTGIGMDSDFIDHLFEKFSQENATDSRIYGGTGLGMSISKELIELMGGTIKIESVKNEGTTATFTIPFEIGSYNDLPRSENIEPPKDLLAGKTILVADDNDMNRLVSKTILTKHGAKVIEAINGFDAVKKVQEQAIDLILLDVQMPQCDGYDAARQIRNLNYDTPIIAHTANALKGEREKCIRAGMNAYIAKPIRKIDLLLTIQSLLNELENKGMEEQTLDTDHSSDVLYDTTNLHDISNGDVVFVKQMIDLFCLQAPESIEAIKKAYAIEDYQKLYALVHKIKPSFDNLGIQVAIPKIRELEELAKEESATEKMRQLINEIEEIVHRVIEEMCAL